MGGHQKIMLDYGRGGWGIGQRLRDYDYGGWAVWKSKVKRTKLQFEIFFIGNIL